MNIVETIMLDGRPVQVERRDMPIGDLKLDPANPRLRYIVDTIFHGEATDEQLHKELWDRDSVRQLAEAIYYNRGLIEPLIIRAVGMVVEGNCRTVALQELIKMHPNETWLKDAPCRVLPDTIDSTQIAIFLVDAHVAGKTPWDAYEKVRSVWELKEKHGKDLDWIATHLRVQRSKVTHLLTVYEKFEKFLRRHPDPGNVRRFSFFDELYKVKDLRRRTSTEPDFMEKFETWVIDGKIGDSHNVRKLPFILSNIRAKEVFEREGFNKAFTEAVKVNPTLDSPLFRRISEMARALREVPMSELEDLKSGNIAKKTILQELKSALDKIAENANIRL